MTAPTEFPFTEFWYLRGIDHGDKNPKDAWGGYGQDFEEADHIHSHAEVEKFPSDVWLINGIQNEPHNSRQLLVVDLDVHKAPEDFDPDRVTVPTDTAVVRTQNGGHHVYFVVANSPERGAEGDFEISKDVPFGVDIRGEFVKHHVVAPHDIPGVGGDYELVRDEAPKTAFDPDELVRTIEFDGEPLIRYDPGSSAAGGGYERGSVDPPEDLPTCYGAGLELRAEAPEDANLNTHKVNVLTALCGLAAGYDVDNVVSHFVDEYYPGEPKYADRETTEYQVAHLAEKLDAGDYSPPSISTLRNYGILPEGVGCRCDIPSHDGGPADRRRIEALADKIEALEGEDLSDSQEKSLATLAARVPADVYGDRREEVAAVLSWDPADLNRHRELTRHQDDLCKIQVRDGRTFYIRDGAPRSTWEVLNFEFAPRSILELEGEEKIQANLGEGREAQFSPKAFQRPQRFKDLIGDYVGLTFDAETAASTVLNELNEYVGRADIPRRRGTHHIGLHEEEWVIPHGSLRADGWADDPETVYVERKIGIERKVALTPQSAEYDAGDVRQIVKNLPTTRNSARFLSVLAWYYAAPLRPYIFDAWNAGQFNHLNVTGDTGSGKTTTLRYLWRCFGVDGDPHAVGDTNFSLTATMAASRGLPVWYDEHKPSDIQDYKLNRFYDLYRKAATGGVESRGNPDQTTTEYELHAPLVVSGEEQINRPAERRRSIMVNFREDVTEKGSETRRRFKELVGEGRVENGELVIPDEAPDPLNHALAYYRWIAGADPADLRAKWEDARELVWQVRQGWDAEFDLDDLEIQGLQTVAFGWQVMRAFAGDHGVSPEELPGRETLDAALRHVAEQIGPEGQRESHMDKFLDIFARARAAGYVEYDSHFAFVREGEPEEELRIHLGRSFDAISKYARDHDLGTEDLLSSAEDYRKRFKEAAEADGGYVTEWSQKTPGLGRCVSVSTVRARDAIEFSREAFDTENVPPSPSDSKQSAAVANGGEIPDQDKQRLLKHLRLERDTGDTVKPSAIAGRFNMDPEAAKDRLEAIATETKALAKTGDAYEVL